MASCGASTTRRAPPDTGKDRPGLIVDLERVAEPDAPRPTGDPGNLPADFSRRTRRRGEDAIVIPPRVAQHLGLVAAVLSLHLVAVEGDWPFDLAHIPGTRDRFDYGSSRPGCSWPLQRISRRIRDTFTVDQPAKSATHWFAQPAPAIMAGPKSPGSIRGSSGRPSRHGATDHRRVPRQMAESRPGPDGGGGPCGASAFRAAGI